MDLKKLSMSTQSKISYKTLMYLMKEDNFKELEKNDKEKTLKIKRTLDNNFKINLILISSVYCLTNYFITRRIKANFLNRILDFSFLSGIAYLGSLYNYRKNIQNNNKDIKYLKSKYSLLIKNTISLLNKKENKDFYVLNIHTRYTELNFLFLLLVRLFV